MDIFSRLEGFIGVGGAWHGLAYSVFILLGVLVAVLAIHFLLRKRYSRAGGRDESAYDYVWRDAVLGALNAPLQGIVWIIGISIVVRMLAIGGDVSYLAELFPPLRDAGVIVIGAWFLIRLAAQAAENLRGRARARGQNFDETAADAIVKSVIALSIIIGALMLLQRFGFSIASLLAFGGVAGIAFGFAAQGLVANLLGGVTIYASRPFRVGDHIIFPGTNPTGYIGWQAGEVQHIGWRATRILDWNGKPFYVPNAKFNTETIINHSRMAFREVSQYIHIRLQDIDRVDGIVTDVNRMLEEHPEMGDYIVFRFDSYGDYALKLYLYAYTAGHVTAYTDYMRVKQDLLLKIAAIITRHGAKLAVPVATVHLPDGQGPGPLPAYAG